MAREKSPGLKILWIWTLGTAAILVTNVVRTRLRDMDKLVNNEELQNQKRGLADSVTTETSPESDEGIFKELK